MSERDIMVGDLCFIRYAQPCCGSDTDVGYYATVIALYEGFSRCKTCGKIVASHNAVMDGIDWKPLLCRLEKVPDFPLSDLRDDPESVDREVTV